MTSLSMVILWNEDRRSNSGGRCALYLQSRGPRQPGVWQGVIRKLSTFFGTATMGLEHGEVES